eukprot:TRINITY_DN3121_c4_g1_i1.p1 TRINITY_DN3121_c4_g1~~TRINITY_DN3121_c4_g1_i1.p1  ORF type:complete len:331 (+),score=57.14 TRINITY_DN3121_c4_g1_i1:29-1021(+)
MNEKQLQTNQTKTKSSFNKIVEQLFGSMECFSFSYFYFLVFIVLFLLLCLIIGTLLPSIFPLDVCHVNPVNKSGFNFYQYTVLIIYANLFIYLVLYGFFYTKDERYSVFSINLTIVFDMALGCLVYQLALYVNTFLKIYIGDLTCNKHPNSVSGHYHFQIFVLLFFPWLKTRQMGKYNLKTHFFFPMTKNSHFVERLTTITYYILVVSCIPSLFTTFIFGYHSMRQCIYGSIHGVISQTMTNILGKSFNFHLKTVQKPKIWAGVTLASFFLTAFALAVNYGFMNSGFAIFDLILLVIYSMVFILFKLRHFQRSQTIKNAGLTNFHNLAIL